MPSGSSSFGFKLLKGNEMTIDWNNIEPSKKPTDEERKKAIELAEKKRKTHIDIDTSRFEKEMALRDIKELEAKEGKDKQENFDIDAEEAKFLEKLDLQREGKMEAELDKNDIKLPSTISDVEFGY